MSETTDWFQADTLLLTGNNRSKAIAAQGMRDRIELRHGRLAPGAQYKDSGTRVPFFCPEGHLASISRDGLLNGAWCKTCNPVLRYTLGEELVRLAFQLMFGKQFPKSRPSFLINPDTGYPLELDGYCEELQLAFEYHGNQHFQFIPYFHKTVDSFEAAKVRDEYTRQLAKEHGIVLVELSGINRGAEPDELLNFVEGCCATAGVAVSAYDRAKYDIALAFRLKTGSVQLREIVGLRQGLLLSEFKGWSRQVDVKCANPAHPAWSVSPSSLIYQGTWCPACAGEHRSKLAIKKSENELSAWLSRNRGNSIAIPEGKAYRGHSVKYDFTCQCGYVNKAIPFALIKAREKAKRSWCIHCHAVVELGRQATRTKNAYENNFAQAEALACELGFVLVGSLGSLPDSEMQLCCVANPEHKPKLTIYRLRKLADSHRLRGFVACQFCDGRQKKTVADAQALACELGGEFLDNNFMGVKHQHQWSFNGKVVSATMDALQVNLRRRKLSAADV